MTKNEELIKAAQVIKEFCSIGGNCGEMGCPFCDRSGNCCISSDRSVSTVYPADWELPKPRRWTDTDILWAKAAKASGAVEIFRTEGSACATSFLADFDDWNNAIEFPNSAFSDMKNDEHIYIDEILKEENQNG